MFRQIFSCWTYIDTLGGWSWLRNSRLYREHIWLICHFLTLQNHFPDIWTRLFCNRSNNTILLRADYRLSGLFYSQDRLPLLLHWKHLLLILYLSWPMQRGKIIEVCFSLFADIEVPTHFKGFSAYSVVPWKRNICHTHIKKRGTFSIFSTQGVWRYLFSRITKSPRHQARAFLQYSCWTSFSRQTFG